MTRWSTRSWRACAGASPRRATRPRRRRTALREVDVALGERAYTILIGDGLVEAAGAHIAHLAPGAQCAVVTDETVAALHLETTDAEPRRARA